jgi:hypothetical protein
MAAAGALTVALRVEPAAAACGTDGEVRRLALRGLSVRTRQRRTNQRPMHRPFVPIAVIFDRLILGRLIRLRRVGCSYFGVRRYRLRLLQRLLLFHWLVVWYLFLDARHGRPRTWPCFQVCRRRRTSFPTSRRGNPGLLVFMVRVTRGAARLLHRIVNHRNDGVIGNAALARTVVVENVTEPNPALLHELPPEPIPSGGMREKVQGVREV